VWSTTPAHAAHLVGLPEPAFVAAINAALADTACGSMFGAAGPASLPPGLSHVRVVGRSFRCRGIGAYAWLGVVLDAVALERAVVCWH
jgi:hypothetical protein